MCLAILQQPLYVLVPWRAILRPWLLYGAPLCLLQRLFAQLFLLLRLFQQPTKLPAALFALPGVARPFTRFRLVIPAFELAMLPASPLTRAPDCPGRVVGQPFLLRFAWLRLACVPVRSLASTHPVRLSWRPKAHLLMPGREIVLALAPLTDLGWRRPVGWTPRKPVLPAALHAPWLGLTPVPTAARFRLSERR